MVKRVVLAARKFHRTPATAEKNDIESFGGELRELIEIAVDRDGTGQSTIREIK